MPRTRLLARAALTLAALTTAYTAVTVAVLAPAAAAAAPPSPAFPAHIDGYPVYDGQTSCSPSAKPGAIALRDMLLEAYPGSRNLGISRACDQGGRSEHKEGRAFDWGVHVDRPAERAQAEDLLAWLLATDEHGNPHARARRLGVMYMIWNRRIWRSYAGNRAWGPYSGRSPHTDHVHITLSRAAAQRQTTWWTLGQGVATPPPAPSGPAVPLAADDLVAIKYGGASQTTEAHVVDGTRGFGGFDLQTPTALHPTRRSGWSFAAGDATRDGRTDLYAIKRRGANGRVEVHVLDGASRYGRFASQTPTPLISSQSGGATFLVADQNRDGVDDLWMVKPRGANGSAEVHVLDGAQGFGRFLLQTPIAVATRDASRLRWTAGDVDRDGRADLLAVDARDRRGYVKVRVLDGADLRRTLGTHETPLATRAATGLHYLAGDHDRDGVTDLVMVKPRGASGHTEVHVLAGRRGFGEWLLHTATALPLSRSTGEFAYAVARG